MTLNPRKPVSVELTFKGPDALKKGKDFLERGVPIDVRPGEVELRGSPLFDTSDYDVAKIQHTLTYEPELRFWAEDAKGRSVASIDVIRGKLVGGRSELRYNGAPPENPLAIRFTIDVHERPAARDFTVEFDLRKWTGQQVSRLAFFEQINGVFQAINRGCTPAVECSLLGNRLFERTWDPGEFSRLSGLQALPILGKAREIVRKTGADPQLPNHLTREHIREIDELHSLLTLGRYSRTGNAATLTVRASRAGVADWLTKLGDKTPDGRMSATLGVKTFPFLNTDVDAGITKLRFCLSFARLRCPLDDLSRQVEQGKLDEIEMQFVGAPDSELVLETTQDDVTSEQTGSEV